MTGPSETPSRYLGIDIGGTKSAVLVGTADGNVLDRREWPSQASRGPDAMIADILDAARAMGPVASAGVSVGGPLLAGEGMVLSPPHLPGWDNVPLRRLLEDEFGIPVHVEHDAAATALAEYRWGGWGDVHALVYFTCGTGFGAGVVIDGRIYRGAGGHSLEIGHARYAPDGPDAFGKTGSIEAYCSGTGLGLLSDWRFGRRQTPRELAAAAEQGDAQAREILHLHAEATGQVCANVADLLFPDVMLLGSLARYLGETWLDAVHARFADEVHPHARQRCRLEPAALQERTQDLAALVVAIQPQEHTS